MFHFGPQRPVGPGLLPQPAHAQETFKLGIVTFLSGPAAESFGVPAAPMASWRPRPKSPLNDWYGGKKPSAEEIAAALRGSEWDSPGGKIQMALANGQQAIQPIAIGRTRYDTGKKMVVADDIQLFRAECVNPPANAKSVDWIKAGFPGARCD